MSKPKPKQCTCHAGDGLLFDLQGFFWSCNYSCSYVPIDVLACVASIVDGVVQLVLKQFVCVCCIACFVQHQLVVLHSFTFQLSQSAYFSAVAISWLADSFSQELMQNSEIRAQIWGDGCKQLVVVMFWIVQTVFFDVNIFNDCDVFENQSLTWFNLV